MFHYDKDMERVMQAKKREILAELEKAKCRILKELSGVDKTTLTRLREIIADYNRIDFNLNERLNNHEARFNEFIENGEVFIVNGENVIKRFENEIAQLDAIEKQLEDLNNEITLRFEKQITPEMFEGSDAEKVQQAFEHCVNLINNGNNAYIVLNKTYDLTGETVVIPSTIVNLRQDIKVYGNGAGGFVKNDSGYFFVKPSTQTNNSTRDLYFIDCNFKSTEGCGAVVFKGSRLDTDEFNALRIIRCNFVNVDTLIDADEEGFIIAMRLIDCNIHGGTGDFIYSKNGMHSCLISGNTLEYRNGNFLNSGNYFKTSVVNNLFQTTTGTIITITRSMNLNIEGNYFEANEKNVVINKVNNGTDLVVNFTSNRCVLKQNTGNTGFVEITGYLGRLTFISNTIENGYMFYFHEFMKDVYSKCYARNNFVVNPHYPTFTGYVKLTATSGSHGHETNINVCETSPENSPRCELIDIDTTYRVIKTITNDVVSNYSQTIFNKNQKTVGVEQNASLIAGDNLVKFYFGTRIYFNIDMLNFVIPPYCTLQGYELATQGNDNYVICYVKSTKAQDCKFIATAIINSSVYD